MSHTDALLNHSTINDVINRYVGVPFIAEGRDPSGWECWGLVEYILKHEFKIIIPDQYSQIYENHAATINEIKNAINSGKWVKVKTPKDCDVLAMGYGRYFHHVGIWLNGGCLHVLEGAGTIYSSIAGLKKHGFKRLEWYRWQQ